MVYIFGIDFPLMETLAVIVILIFLALIIAFMEIFKLKKLIQIEEKPKDTDNQKDRAKPKEEGAAAKKQSFFSKLFKKKVEEKRDEKIDDKTLILVNYIKACTQRRVNPQVMYRAILSRGWTQQDIDKANKIILGKKK